MFGIVRPCRHRMCADAHSKWLGHLCGLCLTLRDLHGHQARLVTNYDALLISVLVEAQSAEPIPYRTAAPCPLRSFQRASVVASSNAGAQLAAAVSLVLAATKIRDHVSDRDGVMRSRAMAGLATWIADRWEAAGASAGDMTGFNTAVLVDAVRDQAALERGLSAGDSILTVTEPTEIAVAAACAHTAVLAGVPENAEPLSEVGRFFGRIAHLLDAVEDYAEDARTGAFNPLRATGTSLEEARRLCDDAHHGLTLALDDVRMPRGGLARMLLVREVRHAIDDTFARVSPEPRTAIPPATPKQPPEPGIPPVTRPQGCTAPFLIGGACALTTCTCGLYQPPWSKRRHAKCGDRCWCERCRRNCDCDCSDCCDCDCSCD